MRHGEWQNEIRRRRGGVGLGCGHEGRYMGSSVAISTDAAGTRRGPRRRWIWGAEISLRLSMARVRPKLHNLVQNAAPRAFVEALEKAGQHQRAVILVEVLVVALP